MNLEALASELDTFTTETFEVKDYVDYGLWLDQLVFVLVLLLLDLHVVLHLDVVLCNRLGRARKFPYK